METQTANIQKEDIFTTYEVTPERRCVNEKGKSAIQICNDIKSKVAPELLECLDYISPDDKAVYISGARVIVYTVMGGSEGWYLHVDMIHEGKIANLILMKTLDWKPDNIKLLERAVWDIVSG